jgi:hypothetical protein
MIDQPIPHNVSGLDAEFSQIESEVAAVDAAAPENIQAEKQAEQAQQSALNEVAELKTLLQIISGLFVPFIPKLAEIYTDQECERLAVVTVPVMQKHGWTTGGMMGQYAAELALLAVAAPIGIRTYHAVKEELKPKQKPKQIEAKAEPVQPEQMPLPDGEQKPQIGAMGLERG